MNTDEIEKIALEVAHMGCTTYRHQPAEHGEKYLFSEQHILDFATRFLAAIDAERGKAAVAWVDTLDTARPRCITNLDYRSLIEAELGVEYVPLFLTSTSTPTVPEGMCLVPINPTAEMRLAGREADEAWGESTVPPVEFEEGLAVIYRAMIDAAQGECK